MPPRAADLFIAVVFGWWALVALASGIVLERGDVVALLPIVVITALVRRYKLGIYASNTYMSLSMAGNLAAGMLAGPAGAVFCSSVTMLAVWSPGVPLRTIAFNLGVSTISNAGAAACFLAMTRTFPETPLLEVPAAALVGLVSAVAESAFVSIIIALTRRMSPRAVWEENFRWSLPHWMGMGVIAYGLALTYRVSGLTGLLAFTGPVLLMRYAMKQYLDHTARSVQQISARNAELEQANAEIMAMTVQLQETYAGTLEALVAALDARDRETRGHSVRVSQLTCILAREMGVVEDSQQWKDIARGSLLHDIGKIGVADAILRKPGALLEEEWQEMRRHARIGFEMLKDIPFLAGAAEIVACHHERWDGKGYPRGLKGAEIPLGARIFPLSDTFDAMATDRPYRKARSYDECWAEIERCSGTQFDPAAVEALRRVFPQWVEVHREGLARAGIGGGRLSVVA